MNVRRRLTYALVILVALTAASVAGYRLLGGHSVKLIDALYMAVITLAGVGYGEIVPTENHPLLRVFNMFVVLFGVALMGFVYATVTAFFVEGELSNLFWRRKMEKRIGELKKHYIVCGLGDTGRHAVEELHKTRTPFVIVENSEENISRFKQHMGEAFGEILYIMGDATDEEVLDHAGIDRAKGLIAAVAEDKDSLVITVVARQKNPQMRIVSRCTDVKFSERILKAGANSTVSPNRIGGMRLASEMLRPHVVSFLDIMLKEHSRTLRVEEIEVAGGSPWIGRTLGDLNLRGRFNLLPLAVKTAVPLEGRESSFWVNPPDSTALQAAMVIIVLGDMADLHRARHEAGHDTPAGAAAAALHR